MTKSAFHGGGASYKTLGEDFKHIDKYRGIVDADGLDAWFDPSPKAVQKIRRLLPLLLKKTPPLHGRGLTETIAKYRKVPAANIITAGGSSDLMFAFFPHMLKRGDKVLILDPMYGEYAHIFENVLNLKVFRYELQREANFIISFEGLRSAIKKINPKMLVMVNPNSPTGQYFKSPRILKLARLFPKTTFVIDETYIEYVGGKNSLESAAIRTKNLVILKSMSKVYALSGARVGYLVAPREIVQRIVKFFPPWAVSLIAQVAAIEALKDRAYYQKKYQATHKLRKAMISAFRKVASVQVFDSVGNFFLMYLKRHSAKKVIAKLETQKIYLRNAQSISRRFNDRYIRIAVRDNLSNKKVVSALTRILK